MDSNAGIQKLRAASCSVLLLLLTLALVASSLLVARYAVQASSWWLSLLAVTVCLLGLCTWIQLAASRAGRWRMMLARQARQANVRSPIRVLPVAISRLGSDGRLGARVGNVAVIPYDVDAEVGYRVAGPPPPPPYSLTDLPPSYCLATAPPAPPGPPECQPAPACATPPAPPAPPSPAPDALLSEPPPPYSVAIKRDDIVQEAVSAVPPNNDVTANNNSISNNNSNRTGRRPAPVSRRPILWY